MAAPRYRQKRDANEAALLRALEDLHVMAKPMRPPFPGWPDAMAIVAGVPHFPEFKTDRGGLTDEQVAFREQMRRAGVAMDDFFPVLSSVDDVIAWVGRRRQELRS